jgi:hypothetical protein
MAFNITPQAIATNVLTGINLLTSSLAQDVVGIFDNAGFNQLFTDARPIGALVRETSRIMDHPIETSVILSDHQVVLPMEIQIQFIITAQFYQSTYQNIRQAFLQAQNLTIHTRTAVYSNMVIIEMPHQETVDMYDAITISIKFREVLIVPQNQTGAPLPPSNYSPGQDEDQSIVARGLQAAVGAAASITSLLRVKTLWGL